MKALISAFLVTGLLSPMAFAKADKVMATKIEFEKGSTMLSADQKKSIEKFVRSAPNNGEEMELGLAVWSDEAYPAGDMELSDEQQEIADNRAEAITEYVESLKFEGEMESHNMAKKTGWLAELFNTSDKDIKSAVEKKNMSDDVMKERYQAYKKEGDARRAVLVMTKKSKKM